MPQRSERLCYARHLQYIALLLKVVMLNRWAHYDALPKLLDIFNCKSKGENNERIRSSSMLPGSQHFGGKETLFEFWDGD
jgi:hypothetical protein